MNNLLSIVSDVTLNRCDKNPSYTHHDTALTKQRMQGILRHSLAIAVLYTAVTLSGCTSVPEKTVGNASVSAHGPGRAALPILAKWMSGYFSSSEQAEKNADYLAIELRVVPIWPERSDGPWLYVEQATAKTPDKPYRQRVYRLVYLNDAQGDRFESRVYALPGDSSRIAGAWKLQNPLSDIAAESLNERMGCTVIMRRDITGRFIGATDAENCVSDLRGASYATAKVTVTENMMESWDQGFAKQGEERKQVWGATQGPYQFKKRAQTVK